MNYEARRAAREHERAAHEADARAAFRSEWGRNDEDCASIVAAAREAYEAVTKHANAERVAWNAARSAYREACEAFADAQRDWHEAVARYRVAIAADDAARREYLMTRRVVMPDA